MAVSLHHEYENIQKIIQGILTSEVKNIINVTEFVNKRWYSFYNHGLMRKLKEYKEDWEGKSGDVCKPFQKCIDNILKDARKCVPDVNELEEELKAGGDHGVTDVYKYYLDKMRTDFTEKFLDIDEKIFDKIINDIKKDIVNIFAEDNGGRMKYIVPVDENFPRTEWLSYAVIDQILQKDIYSQFKTAFNVLTNFKLTVRGFLMHKVRSCAKRLELGNKIEFSDNASEHAKEVHWNLDVKITETCDELEEELSGMYTDPNGIFSSVIGEFYDRLSFSSVMGRMGAEDLWKSLYYDNCPYVWGEEFNDVNEMSDIYSEWESLKTELGKYSKQDFIINI